MSRKIVKNSIYGVYDDAMHTEPDDLYCDVCLSKRGKWYMDIHIPFGCYNCKDGINFNVKFIKLDEVRKRKIDKLTHEH